LAKRFQI